MLTPLSVMPQRTLFWHTHRGTPKQTGARIWIYGVRTEFSRGGVFLFLNKHTHNHNIMQFYKIFFNLYFISQGHKIKKIGSLIKPCNIV